MEVQTFHKLTEVEEGLALKAQAGKDGRFLAGGTDVLVHMHEGKNTASVILDLTGIKALKGIEAGPEWVRIGSMATFTEAWQSEVLAPFTGLTEACRSVGSPQIRNAGTLGGNVANGSPAADSAPPLLALDARLLLKRQGADRWVPLCEFYAGKGSTVLADDELLAEIRIPLLASNAVVSFEKLGLRNALAISRISLALYLEAENGLITGARAGSGSIGLSPMREPVLENFLMGKPLDAGWLEEGKTLFSKHVEERLSGRATMPYKREAIKGVFEKAVLKALRALQEKGFR